MSVTRHHLRRSLLATILSLLVVLAGLAGNNLHAQPIEFEVIIPTNQVGPAIAQLRLNNDYSYVLTYLNQHVLGFHYLDPLSKPITRQYRGPVMIPNHTQRNPRPNSSHVDPTTAVSTIAARYHITGKMYKKIGADSMSVRLRFKRLLLGHLLVFHKFRKPFTLDPVRGHQNDFSPLYQSNEPGSPVILFKYAEDTSPFDFYLTFSQDNEKKLLENTEKGYLLLFDGSTRRAYFLPFQTFLNETGINPSVSNLVYLRLDRAAGKLQRSVNRVFSDIPWDISRYLVMF